MANSLSSFPVLTDDLRKQINFYVGQNYIFSYMEKGTLHELFAEEVSEGSKVHKIYDQSGHWNPDDFDFNIYRSFRLEKTRCLFGPKGIACFNARIGVAIVWKSADSKQRGAIPIGEISSQNDSVELELKYNFERAKLRGKIELTTVLYIKKIGTPYSSEQHLANTYGCLLGELDKYIILLDGTGSEFPIYEVQEPGNPLWHVYCDWEDPALDQFTEVVEIVINSAHPNYYRLVSTEKNYDPQLMIEVIAGALSTIILKLKDDKGYWQDTVQGNSLEKGSVSQAVYYFINTLGWDVSTPEALAISIRKYIEQRMSL